MLFMLEGWNGVHLPLMLSVTSYQNGLIEKKPALLAKKSCNFLQKKCLVYIICCMVSRQRATFQYTQLQGAVQKWRIPSKGMSSKRDQHQLETYIDELSEWDVGVRLIFIQPRVSFLKNSTNHQLHSIKYHGFPYFGATLRRAFSIFVVLRPTWLK